MNKYVLWVTKEQSFEIGMIQGGVFQAYQYPDLGITTNADWRHVIKAHTDPDLNRLRSPGKVLDPNGAPVPMEEMIELVKNAQMIPRPQ
jgi:hypothetical protein